MTRAEALIGTAQGSAVTLPLTVFFPADPSQVRRTA